MNCFGLHYLYIQCDPKSDALLYMTLGQGGINTHYLTADVLHTRIHSLTGVCLHGCNSNTFVAF